VAQRSNLARDVLSAGGTEERDGVDGTLQSFRLLVRDRVPPTGVLAPEY
jgi:hypothetical protein